MKHGYAILLVPFGLWLAYWLKKRQFGRTNSAGVEEFTSYGSKLFVTTVEKIAWVIAITCVLIGAIFAL